MEKQKLIELIITLPQTFNEWLQWELLINQIQLVMWFSCIVGVCIFIKKNIYTKLVNQMRTNDETFPLIFKIVGVAIVTTTSLLSVVIFIPGNIYNIIQIKYAPMVYILNSFLK